MKSETSSSQWPDLTKASITANRLRAIKDAGLDLEGWRRRVRKPIMLGPDGRTTIGCDGDPDGPLAAHEIVFTGELMMTRAEAAAVAKEIGCNVRESVTKKTTMLVVGLQDLCKLNGYAKSAKHRKAEKLIAAGMPVAILSEDDFMATVKPHEESRSA